MKLNDQFPTFPASRKPVPNGLIPDFGGKPPFLGDQNTWHKTVNGNNWLEELANLPAIVLPRISVLNGTDDIIQTPNVAALNDLTEFTYDFGIIYNKVTGTQVFLDKDVEKYFFLNENIIECVVSYSGTFATVTSNIAILPDVLYCVTIKYSESGDRKIHIFINGIESTYSAQVASIGTISTDVDGKTYIGARGKTSSFFTDCKIKKFKLWNRALTDQEILDEYNGVDVSNTGLLIQYYPTGQDEYDFSGNNYHATWIGTGPRFDYDIRGSLYPLLNGLSMYSNIAKELIRVPYDINGLPLVAPPVPAGYTIRSEHPASIANLNMFDCLIDFLTDNALGIELHTNANAASDPNENEANAVTGFTSSGLAGTGANVFASQSSEKFAGNYAIEANANDTPTGSARFYIDLNAAPFSCITGRRYRMSFFTRHVGVGGAWRISVGPTNDTVSPFIAQLTTAETSFQQYTFEWTHDITTTRYFIAREGSGTNNGGIYFDNFSVKKISSKLDNFNRSNLIIYNDDARAGIDYDSNNPYRIQIDNLDPRILFTWRNVGHKGMLYAKIYLDINKNIIRILEMLNYFSDHVDAEEYQIMIYCGYESIIIVDEFGDYLIDGDDYVLIEGL